ncbi:MAG: NYN domain-containing protein [Anaerolineae bacterium]
MYTQVDRVMCFIDGSNMYNGLTASFGERRIHFARLLDGLAAGRLLVQAYYYTVPNAYNRAFIIAITRNPLVILRSGQQGFNGREKLVDTRLSSDMVRLAYANTYDIAILISGDGDYVDAVAYVRAVGKRVEGYSFASNSSQALRRACDRYTIMDAEFLEPYWL